jgi:nucleoside-diphosphate-sugar epimerase
LPPHDVIAAEGIGAASLEPTRRVFITGALGFIGRALGERYRALGAEVRGVDLRAEEATGVIAGDLTGAGEWQEAMAGSDLVIHTAAVVSNAANLATQWRLNVMGTRLALDGAVSAGVRRFVHLSSIRAFSDLHYPDGADERHPVRTDGSPYVDTKVASEQVVLQAHAAGEIACTVIRPGDVYGPGSRPWTILPLELIKANRFALPAMGRGIFTPVYIDNLLDGIIAAAARAGGSGQVFTLTDGVGVSCRDFFANYYRMLGRRGPICLPTPIAVSLTRGSAAVSRLSRQTSEVNAISMRYFTRTGTYSIAKARRELGYEPGVDLREGMRRTESWLRDRGLISGAVG